MSERYFLWGNGASHRIDDTPPGVESCQHRVCEFRKDDWFCIFTPDDRIYKGIKVEVQDIVTELAFMDLVTQPIDLVEEKWIWITEYFSE